MIIESVQYIVTIVTPLLLLPVLFGRAIHWTYLWQLKEYRLDRFRDYASTNSGRVFLLGWWRCIEAVLFVVTVIILLYSTLSNSTTLLVSFYGITLLYVTFLLLRTIRWRVMPKWTAKTLLIMAVSVLIFSALWGLAVTISPLVTILLLIISPFIQTVIIFAIEPVIIFKKKQIMKKAASKLKEISPTVVGITGSYGKSTTKEFLRTMLAPHFAVLATENNVNVDIGVAQTILDSLDKKHAVFIVEMGAYRKGEIASSCSIATPDISVITAIANQHAALFGSVDDIRDAKSEIVESLSPQGHAILNYDSEGTHGVELRTEATVTWYSMSDPTAVHANNVHMLPHEVQFDLHIGEKSIPVTATLHGKQAIPSILAAASVAHHLGLSLEDIANGIGRLSPVSGTMNVQDGINGAIIIDDSYNSNPDGFIAALDYMQTFTDKRKIVITNGMYELGDYAENEHHRVGKVIADTADYILIGKEDYAEPLITGAVGQGMPDHLIFIGDIEQQLRGMALQENDVVLIQGRVSAQVIDYLVHTK